MLPWTHQPSPLVFCLYLDPVAALPALLVLGVLRPHALFVLKLRKGPASSSKPRKIHSGGLGGLC